MDRKNFIKKSLLASLVGWSGTTNAKPEERAQTLEQIGFNHLPNKENQTMNTVLHKANTRGNANHGWLQSYHSFSFANYYNPERTNFGVLRVLNDDTVAAARGFGRHPHDNMEIISIPLSGDLEHKDSMGNTAIIKQGDVQVMSAGTGIFHSEYNHSKEKAVKFLQIWVFPNKRNVTPRYDQISIRDIYKKNAFYQILSPSAADQGVWVHQDAWFSLGDFEAEKEDKYKLNKKGNGVYLFVLDGSVEVQGQKLDKRDGFGIWNINEISLKASSNSKVLLMEVPMKM